jgi:hypothetical protein
MLEYTIPPPDTVNIEGLFVVDNNQVTMAKHALCFFAGVVYAGRFSDAKEFAILVIKYLILARFYSLSPELC